MSDTDENPTDGDAAVEDGVEETPPPADAGASATPGAPAEAEDEGGRPDRKVREGRVISNGMQKTAVVLVTDRVRHPRYNKTLQRSKKLHVHDEADDLQLGDIVRVMETRPLSKTKRWRLVEVVERAR